MCAHPISSPTSSNGDHADAPAPCRSDRFRLRACTSTGATYRAFLASACHSHPGGARRLCRPGGHSGRHVFPGELAAVHRLPLLFGLCAQQHAKAGALWLPVSAALRAVDRLHWHRDQVGLWSLTRQHRLASRRRRGAPHDEQPVRGLRVSERACRRGGARGPVVPLSGARDLCARRGGDGSRPITGRRAAQRIPLRHRQPRREPAGRRARQRALRAHQCALAAHVGHPLFERLRVALRHEYASLEHPSTHLHSSPPCLSSPLISSRVPQVACVKVLP